MEIDLNKTLSIYNIDLHNIDFVAFDVFDTILYRTIPPLETHRLWANLIKQKYQLSNSCEDIVKMKFALARKLKLKSVSRACDKEYSYNDLVTMLYNKLRIRSPQEDFLDNCIEYEYKVESKSTYIPQHIFEWIKELKDAGKKVICISDYYLPKYFLMKLLNEKGIEVENVFTSSDFLLQKKSGRLYGKVLKELSISPDKILMIGDSYLSDYINPRKYGIDSILLDKNMKKTFMVGDVKADASQLLKPHNMGVSNIPFASVAYLMFLFVDRLYTKLRQDRKTYALFMSREGEFFKKVFDTYQELCIDEKERIRTHYFYVSRRATLISSVHTICGDSFKEIFRNYNNIRPSTFFKNLQLADNKKIREEFSDLFATDNEIERFSQSEVYRRTLLSPIFADECLKKAKEQRGLLERYIESFGEDIAREGLNIVDVGYGGTAQNNMYSMYGGNVKINGYYMYSRALDSTDKSHKDGILYDINIDKNENIFIYNSAVIEMLCLASHCGVDSYKEEDGRIVPIFHHNQEEIDCYRDVISTIQSNILKFFCQIVLTIKNSRLKEDDYIVLFKQEYKKFIFNPSTEEMNLYLKIPFEDNFAIYRTYTVDKEEKKHSMFSINGTKILLQSKFGALKSQNTHWIAAAAFKLDMRVLNYIMVLFPNITMKAFNMLKQRAKINNGL